MDRLREVIQLREYEYQALTDLAEQARRDYDILSIRVERALEELKNAQQQLKEMEDELNHKLFREDIHRNALENWKHNQKVMKYDRTPKLFD